MLKACVRSHGNGSGVIGLTLESCKSHQGFTESFGMSKAMAKNIVEGLFSFFPCNNQYIQYDLKNRFKPNTSKCFFVQLIDRYTKIMSHWFFAEWLIPSPNLHLVLISSSFYNSFLCPEETTNSNHRKLKTIVLWDAYCSVLDPIQG